MPISKCWCPVSLAALLLLLYCDHELLDLFCLGPACTICSLRRRHLTHPLPALHDQYFSTFVAKTTFPDLGAPYRGGREGLLGLNGVPENLDKLSLVACVCMIVRLCSQSDYMRLPMIVFVVPLPLVASYSCVHGYSGRTCFAVCFAVI